MTCDGVGALQTTRSTCVHKDAFLNRFGARMDNWPTCTDADSAFDCVCGTICSTSSCTYGESLGTHGYDFVADGFFPEYLYAREQFVDGIMNASFWNVSSATISDLCGGYPAKIALRFSGPNRAAVTRDFDLSSGGTFEFYLRIGNMNNIACAAAVVGSVTIAYSSDEGVTWSDSTTFYVSKYKGSDFKIARAPLPPNGWSPHTRFKIYQKQFEPIVDHFAVGYINIYKSLPNSEWCGAARCRDTALTVVSADWQAGATWKSFEAAVQQGAIDAQCCLNCYTCDSGHVYDANTTECETISGYSKTPSACAAAPRRRVFVWRNVCVCV